MKHWLPIGFLATMFIGEVAAQHSVARQWNEILLNSIRVDIGRPTVHARNLFHVSAAMYDAWAAFDQVAEPYFLGKDVHGVYIPFDGIEIPKDPGALNEARDMAVSYAAYRMLLHRFRNSPGVAITRAVCDQRMYDLGYDTTFASIAYLDGNPAALGNYIAQSVIDYGLLDGSNEQGGYAQGGFGYVPVNPPLNPNLPGTQGLVNLDRWQPLSFSAGMQTPFLTPHWGDLSPFSLTAQDLTVFERDGRQYNVYHDPGPPPYLESKTPGLDDEYKWNFALVAVWSGLMDPDNPVMIDISPASIGNVDALPETFEEARAFYDFFEGGVFNPGYSVNPKTGDPYEPQFVPRGDFGRVLAEFWADGPASETPPGHWFTILNYVNDHPLFEKRFKGEGPVLDDLEWDVKCYLTLGAAMHDVAVAVWSIKAWYDYVRPITAIRGMAELGQSSDETLPGYHPEGIPLIEGHIELVAEGDLLAGENDEHVGKVKLFAWRGPDYIGDPATEYAGCGWILAENWWPYQRPTFVTPPFAGYISGHSTFSRAAAEVLALLTGDEYFPGGLGEFHAPQNAYLVFEDGPSVDMTLQWARYVDASNESSLSRLWGGIHPPADDLPGRRIGALIADEVFELAAEYFNGKSSSVRHLPNVVAGTLHCTPNPVSDRAVVAFTLNQPAQVQLSVLDMHGRQVAQLANRALQAGAHQIAWNGRTAAGEPLPPGIYACRLISDGHYQPTDLKIVVVQR